MYVRTTLTEKVKLAPHDLHGDYETRVYEHLKTKLEGKCTRFGYIKEGSIEPVSIHMGTLEPQTFRGFVVFDVKCTASICNPTVGLILRAKVVSANNFGLLCMSLDDTGSSGSSAGAQVMDIIVPKDMKTVTSAVDTRQVRVGDIVDVQLIGKKYELYSTKIVVVGVIQRVEAAAAAVVGNATKPGRKSAAATDTLGTAAPVAAPSTVASRLLAFDDEDDFTFDDDEAEADDEETKDADVEADEGGVDGTGEDDAEDRPEDRVPSGDDDEEDDAKEGDKSKSDEEESEDEAFEEEGFDEDDEEDIHYSDDE